MRDKFQVVFSREGIVELMLLNGEIRSVTFDSTDSPFTVDGMNDPEVRTALYQWMLDTNAEGWIGTPELLTVLDEMGVNIRQVVARHPA